MTTTDSSSVDQRLLATSLASFIQIGALLIITYWCFVIIAPFVTVVLWALIMAVAIYPVHVNLAARLGGREKIAATILVLVSLAILAVPLFLLAESTVDIVRSATTQIEEGTAQVPPPSERVAKLPVIGPQIHAAWSAAANDLQSAVSQYRPQLQSAARWLLGAAGHTAVAALLFAVAIVVAGAFLTTASAGYAATCAITSKLVGAERGPAFADLAILTIRSVAKGVLGVAIIQTMLSAVGMLVAGVPAAGLWSAAVLVLALVQLPPMIVMGPVAIWYLSVADPLPALVFLVYAIFVSFSDTFLKPLLLGRGVEVPMLVILIGAIGGAIAKGFLGLFVGAVILALGYELVKLWMVPQREEPDADDTAIVADAIAEPPRE